MSRVPASAAWPLQTQQMSNSGPSLGASYSSTQSRHSSRRGQSGLSDNSSAVPRPEGRIPTSRSAARPQSLAAPSAASVTLTSQEVSERQLFPKGSSEPRRQRQNCRLLRPLAAPAAPSAAEAPSVFGGSTFRLERIPAGADLQVKGDKSARRPHTGCASKRSERKEPSERPAEETS